jgi:hypothetical protein
MQRLILIGSVWICRIHSPLASSRVFPQITLNGAAARGGALGEGVSDLARIGFCHGQKGRQRRLFVLDDDYHRLVDEARDRGEIGL